MTLVHRAQRRARALDIAKLGQRATTRVGFAHAAIDELLGARVDVERDLVVDVSGDPHRDERAEFDAIMSEQ